MNYPAAITREKAHRGAVILAHYYQPPEIQAAADLVGDSLQLAQAAQRLEAEVIVICGVKFMAESAKILNPERTVLMPEPEAGCPMADMVDAAGLKKLKAMHPSAVVVTYVNSSAEVKAESDVCCTSSNAWQVINSLPADREIIFCPDQNLGANIMKASGRKMILWSGYCPIHHQVTNEDINRLQKLHPKAPVVVHPECPPPVVTMADAVLSTAGILDFVKANAAMEFIIGTERGLITVLEKQNPGKRFYLAKEELYCPDMKMITLEKLHRSLTDMVTPVEVPEEISQKARLALERMTALG
ncbi:MAG: quinolinate synthase NadA [Methylocystaceae bacterium]